MSGEAFRFPVQGTGDTALLTRGTASVGQGQEWRIQGPTGVPQNRVPMVNEGHGLRVPAAILGARERFKVMEKRAFHESR